MKTPMRLVGAVLAATTLVGAACGSDKADNSSTTTKKASACPVDKFKSASKPTEIVVWHSYVGKLKQTLEKLASEYNASQDKVKVTIESQANSYQELLRKYKQVLPDKKLPAITIGEDIDTQTMVDTKSVLPAQDCIDADSDARAKFADHLLPAFKDHYTIDGKLYPAAMNGSTIVLYYNREHFRKAGLNPDKPPTTLQEIHDAAATLKAKGVSQKPFVLKTDPWFIEHWITGEKQTLVNNDNGRKGLADKSTFDNPATHKVYDWLSSMKTEGLLNDVPGTEGQINHYLAMATQAGSMLVETSAAVTTIDGVIQGTFDPADLGLGDDPTVAGFKGIKLSLDVGVGLNPGITKPGKGQVGGGAWYITNTGTAEVQSAAWDFVKWFNDTPQQVQWTLEGSYLPIMSTVRDDPAVEKDFTTTDKGKWLAKAYEGLTTLDPTFTGPVIGPYTETRDAIRKSTEAMLSTGTSANDAIKQANSAIDKVLKDYKDTNF